MYKVLKVINNNALLANDLTTNDEVIFLGTGVGFGRKTNDLFDEIINAKKYFTTDKIKDISQNIDPIYLDIAELILQQAQTQFATIDYMIQFALADHIAFAIKRMKNNITIVNPFSTDISLLYKKEYEIALQGAKIIEDKLGVMINSDEVGYITLHIHSALGKDNVAESLRIAMIINDALARLENLCHVTLNCRESGYLIQNLIKIIKLFKPSGLYNMTMRVKLYGPFLYKKKGRTQHLTSVSSFTQQCFR